MGKKRAQKDRGYMTASEHKEFAGFKDKSRAPFQRLPFHCCALTFTPFEDPVCTGGGGLCFVEGEGRKEGGRRKGGKGGREGEMPPVRSGL